MPLHPLPSLLPDGSLSLRVRNWEKFQHYHKRNPPWIRLYNEILDNYDFSRLPDASKWHAVGIWLLASRFDNRIPDDPKWIGQRINATSNVDVDALISAGFIEHYDDASDTLAPRTQSATLEGEGEGEGETEVEGESEKRQKRKPSRSLMRTFADDPALWMHGIWTEELGSQQPLAMTKLRQGKYRALFVEQLQGSPDPRLAFRAILHAVKLSTHHMSERAYQMPESLFKDESRRDTWVQKTLAAIASADRQTKGASDFEEYMKERRNRHTNGNGGYGA